MGATAEEAKAGARKAEDSKAVEILARVGLAARGLVYVVIGLLAFQIALGGGGQADKKGALAAIKKQPFGKWLLVILAIGFAGYALWRLLEAAVGHQEEEGKKRVAKRVASAARGLFYASFSYTTFKFVTSGGGGDKTKPLTARVMGHTGGRFLIALVGIAVIGGGLYVMYRGAKKKFLKKLDLATASSTERSVAERTGQVGLIGRGLVFLLIGGFLVEAALAFDPNKAKGLDASLKALAGQPFGPYLLGLAALGLLMFGVWSFVQARYQDL